MWLSLAITSLVTFRPAASRLTQALSHEGHEVVLDSG